MFIGVCLPFDYCGNLTTAHPVVKVCAADSKAIPSLHNLSGSLVKVMAGPLLSLSPFGKQLYVNPGLLWALSRIRCYHSLGSTYVLSSENVLMRCS